MNGAVHVAALLSTPPTILNVTPLGAFAGTTITINGAAFQNGATVTFRGVASPSVTFVNASTLQAVVPDIPIGAAAIVVTNPDAQSATFPGFSVISLAVPAMSRGVLAILALTLVLIATRIVEHT